MSRCRHTALIVSRVVVAVLMLGIFSGSISQNAAPNVGATREISAASKSSSWGADARQSAPQTPGSARIPPAWKAQSELSETHHSSLASIAADEPQSLVAITGGVAPGQSQSEVQADKQGRVPSLSLAPGTPGPCQVYGSAKRSHRLHYSLDRSGFDADPHWTRDISGFETPPHWSTDGRWIVFSEGAEVHMVAMDGTQFFRLVRESDYFHIGSARYAFNRLTGLDVSSDGAALVYAACWTYLSGGNRDMQTVRFPPEGGGPERAICLDFTALVESVGECPTRNPMISDRKILTYPSGDTTFRVKDDFYEITLVRLDQGTATRLHLGNFPALSPDGTRIAFVAQDGRDEPSRLYTMATDGTHVRNLRVAPVNYPPRWSPDGTRLAYVLRDEHPFAIYTINADGTERQYLSTAISGPAWSPDGTRVAFAKADGRSTAVYTIAADGTDARQITTVGIEPTWASAVEWSPDGSRILLAFSSSVWVVNLDGRSMHELVDVHKSPHVYDARSVPAWSPDGKQIALYQPSAGGSGYRYSGGEEVLASVASDGSDPRVLVRDHNGLMAERQEDLVVKIPATTASCRAGVVVSAPRRNAGLVRDCETLVGVRRGLFGTAATNWGRDVPLNDWDGVSVSGSPPRVRKLDFGDGSLGAFDHGGILPTALAELEYLDGLDLSSNRFAGSIPTEWGQLTRLLVLDLSDNALTGEIPPELSGLGRLRVLDLSNNALSGPVPPELAKIETLRELKLRGNPLTGCIPAALSDLRGMDPTLLGLERCVPET